MSRASQAIEHVLRHCGGLGPDEEAVIVCDPGTAAVAEQFAETARTLTPRVVLENVPVASAHGAEPPEATARAMGRADLILGLTSMSIAHTRARLEAGEKGARFLSMPEYSAQLLEDPCLLVDYKSIGPQVFSFASRFTRGSRVHVFSERGTRLDLDIRDRVGNACPGYVDAPGGLGSPPDIEANVSPVETASEGVIVVDGSVTCPEVGRLPEPVTLHVRGGSIASFEASDRGLVRAVEEVFERVGDPKAYVLAECGVGFNPEARLTGVMLTDEGAAGCVHFGFGSNSTVGGQNDVPFHLDFVVKSPSLTIDQELVIDSGVIKS